MGEKLVAKSYKNLEQVGEEFFAANGKSYIKVKLGNGNLKTVRTYSPKEYEKYYGEKPAVATSFEEKTQKEALGFKNGYITIFKGETYSHKEWFKEIGARYTRLWGWGLSSEIELPADLPLDVEAIRLDWTAVGKEDDTLKPDTMVQAAVEALIYPTSGEFVGIVGERIDVEVTVVKAIRLDGYYGPSTLHSMEDSEGHTFTWITGSKSWAEGSVHHIRGTVKDHKTYKGVQQTVLTRCAEVKEK